MKESTAAVILALILAGCEDGRTTYSVTEEPSRPEVSIPRPAAMELPAGRAVAVEQQERDRMLQREAQIVLEVEDVDSAAARVRVIAQDLAGRVERFDQTAGDRQTRRVSMTLRVPEEDLNEAIERVRELGEEERVAMSALDVTEQAQDLQARLRNLRQLEERLLRLLEQRTGDLEEVLAVERELARVRSEIETREMRLQDIERRVAFATLHLELHEPFPLRDRPSDGILARLGRAFLQAGENLLDMVAGLIAALGYVVPLGVVVALIWWLVRRWRRRWMWGSGSE